jgi:hypothetical protein
VITLATDQALGWVLILVGAGVLVGWWLGRTARREEDR